MIMRTRRVGSFTCGVLLILFGVLFILHMLVPAVTYGFIFRLWPVILIFLGVEIIFSNLKVTEIEMKYDLGAIVLIMLLTLFSMVMGAMEFCMAHASMYW